jgi:hypothetical protein
MPGLSQSIFNTGCEALVAVHTTSTSVAAILPRYPPLRPGTPVSFVISSTNFFSVRGIGTVYFDFFERHHSRHETIVGFGLPARANQAQHL